MFGTRGFNQWIQFKTVLLADGSVYSQTFRQNLPKNYGGTMYCNTPLFRPLSFFFTRNKLVLHQKESLSKI